MFPQYSVSVCSAHVHVTLCILVFLDSMTEANLTSTLFCVWLLSLKKRNITAGAMQVEVNFAFGPYSSKVSVLLIHMIDR